MNIPRYVIAGSASLAIHIAILFVAQESKLFAMPAGTNSTTVSINFVPSTSAKPSPQAEPISDPVSETAETQPEQTPEFSEPTPIPPEPQPPKVVKPEPVAQKKIDKTSPRKEVVKKKPKPESKQPKKTQPVAKKTTQKPVTEKKITQKKKIEKKVEKKETEKTVSDTPQQEAKEVIANRGVSTQEPTLIKKPAFSSRPTPPKYPRKARRRGVQGVATYEIWIDADGKQIKQALVSSSGALMLDKAALDAVKQWKFSPHTVNGRAIAHRVQIPVRFRLD